jgi:arsenate reductase
MTKKTRVLFVCNNNSARSQMAEGILKNTYNHMYEVYSAGTEPTGVHPLSIEAMKEIGIDISRQRSKGLDELKGIDFDLAVTLCDQAKSVCPVIPNARMTIHQSFEDPDNDQDSFRKTRDDIREWINTWFKKPDLMKNVPLKL